MKETVKNMNNPATDGEKIFTKYTSERTYSKYTNNSSSNKKRV